MKTVKPEDLVKWDKYRVVRECDCNPASLKGDILSFMALNESGDSGYFYGEKGTVFEIIIDCDGIQAMLLEECTPDTKPDEVLDNLDFLVNFKAGVPHPPKGGY